MAFFDQCPCSTWNKHNVSIYLRVPIKQWHFFSGSCLVRTNEIVPVNYPAQALALSQCWIKILRQVNVDGSSQVDPLTLAMWNPLRWSSPVTPAFSVLGTGPLLSAFFPVSPSLVCGACQCEITDLEKQMLWEEQSAFFGSWQVAWEMKNARTKTNLLDPKTTGLLILGVRQPGYELGDKNGKRLAWLLRRGRRCVWSQLWGSWQPSTNELALINLAVYWMSCRCLSAVLCGEDNAELPDVSPTSLDAGNLISRVAGGRPMRGQFQPGDC